MSRRIGIAGSMFIGELMAWAAVVIGIVICNLLELL